MAAKVLYSYAVTPKTRRGNVLEFLTGLQAQPQHKWIPIEEMSEAMNATVTPRQASWLSAQVAKRVDGAEINFEAAPEAAEDES